jgi:hypothetical protein
MQVTFEPEVRVDPLGDLGDPNGGFVLRIRKKRVVIISVSAR